MCVDIVAGGCLLREYGLLSDLDIWKERKVTVEACENA